jgi:hypothetical protein
LPAEADFRFFSICSAFDVRGRWTTSPQAPFGRGVNLADILSGPDKFDFITTIALIDYGDVHHNIPLLSINSSLPF